MSDFLVMALESDAELYHHGIEGMHWGDRRYQNYDGSLTDEGRKRYGVGKAIKEAKKSIRQLEGNVAQSLYNKNRAEKDLYKITGKGAFRKEREQLSEKNQEKYDKQMKLYTDVLMDLSKNMDTYVGAVDNAKAEFGDTKIKDIKRDKKTGQMKVRLPGQEAWNVAAAAGVLLTPGGLVTAIPVAYALSTLGPQIKASKEYKELKNVYMNN